MTLDPLEGTVAPFFAACSVSVAIPLGLRFLRTLGFGPWYLTMSLAFGFEDGHIWTNSLPNMGIDHGRIRRPLRSQRKAHVRNCFRIAISFLKLAVIHLFLIVMYLLLVASMLKACLQSESCTRLRACSWGAKKLRHFSKGIHSGFRGSMALAPQPMSWTDGDWGSI